MRPWAIDALSFVLLAAAYVIIDDFVVFALAGTLIVAHCALRDIADDIRRGKL